MNPNTNYKDSFFTKLFSEPEHILRLYNAVSGSNYPLDTPIEITTLENVFYKGRYNDLSFIIDGKLCVLIEHQSSINPNMPLRLLIYFAEVIGSYAKTKGLNIYSSTAIQIPRPEFIVLYNGTEDFPEEKTLKLSDAFKNSPEEYNPSGNLELDVRVLNINKGQNQSFVQKSEELSGYVIIVDEIRKNKDFGMTLEEAIANAIKDCKDRDILSDFLEKHGGEVMSLLYAEWKLDEYVAEQMNEAEHRKAIATAKNALGMGLTPEQAAKIADLPIAEVEAISGV